MKTSQKRTNWPLNANIEDMVKLCALMRTLGILKLPEDDSDKFREALRAYGFEKSASFLRRCAYALIRHHQAGEKLAQPLSFEVANSHSPKHRNQDEH